MSDGRELALARGGWGCASRGALARVELLVLLAPASVQRPSR
jgi:hypothetical protein